MPQLLPPQVVRDLAAATSSDQVLNISALQNGVGASLNVLAAWQLSLDGQATSTTLYHESIPLKFQQEHQAAIQRFGLSAMARFAMINPLPFTFSEARQRLQPRGGDHWIFDLLQDYNIRDGLYCAHGPWMMVYWSERALNGIRAAGLSREVRMTLDASSGAAIYRIRELTGRKKTARDSELSPRELAVLQHLAQGQHLSAVAEQLGLAVPTARTYLRRAQEKLNAKTPLEAAVVAVRRRLI